MASIQDSDTSVVTIRRTLDDLLATITRGQRVLLRADLNVPMADNSVRDATRLEQLRPTLHDLTNAGGRVIILSHFGRPGGTPDATLSLAPIARALEGYIGIPVAFAPDCLGETAQKAIEALSVGGILVLENTRFYPEEEANDPAMAQALARYADFFVNDAFSTSHRAHVSTHGLGALLPTYGGRAMEAELQALERILKNPARPVMAIVGGAKISTKLDLLNHLTEKADCIAIGGAMVNSFLAAMGHEIGQSLYESNQVKTVQDILSRIGSSLVLPHDVAVACTDAPRTLHRIASVTDVAQDEIILDLGPVSIEELGTRIRASRTVLWNGPLGAFEISPFDEGTISLARHIALATREGELISIAGGGETVAALKAADVTADLTHVSTAGGAFLEWLEGRTLPGVTTLNRT